MSGAREEKIAANLYRAEEALGASRVLLSSGFYNSTASRAYYVAFHSSAVLLLSEGLEFSKHSGVISSIHRQFVKTGMLTKEEGTRLSWLFELRSIGDYGVIEHVTQGEAQRR